MEKEPETSGNIHTKLSRKGQDACGMASGAGESQVHLHGPHRI